MMKTVLFSMIIIGGLFLSGCASTTLFTTDPEGASVFVKGEEMGTTPYKYSDAKVALSSTPVTFKKDGYKDLNIILKRSEQPAVGAIIGGILLYVPLLWFAEYNRDHFYVLEKIETFNRDIAEISELNIDTALIQDSAIIRQIDLPIVDTLPGDIAKKVTGIKTISEVSPGKDFTKRTISQFGTGLGFCLRGALFGLNYIFIGSKNWGGSIRYKTNIFKSKDVPSDYYDDGYRVFSPKNYVNILSLNMLKGFTTSTRSARFGIEAGPSWVRYSKAEFEPNTHYDPNPDPDVNWLYKIGTKYKYYKDHAKSNTIGLSLIAKLEYLFAPYAGMEFALFTNINSLQPITGICISCNFGDVRD
jgi:hypothetical protein